MKQVVIVVPTQKIFFSPLEKISLRQLYRVLNNYPIKFVIPQKNRDAFLVEHPGWEFECFSDEYFDSVADYSRMCIAPEFYERFIAYKYMLIYQTDAFVFNDQLKYFCDMDYDYIGAPVLYVTWPGVKGRIGNGGLSLRKIEKFISIAKKKEKIFSALGNCTKTLEMVKAYEDAFWGYCSTVKVLDFKVPSVRIASTFSVGCDVGRSYLNLSSNTLPFGCHGWLKAPFYSIWKPYIKKLYQLTEENEEEAGKNESRDYYTFYRDKVDSYRLYRIMRNNANKAKIVMSNLIPLYEKYIIWGNGYWGKEAIEFLKFLGVRIICIFSSDVKHVSNASEIPIVYPSKETIVSQKCKVLIASTSYEKEMTSELLKWGLIRDKDFYAYIILRRKFLKEFHELRNLRGL